MTRGEIRWYTFRLPDKRLDMILRIARGLELIAMPREGGALGRPARGLGGAATTYQRTSTVSAEAASSPTNAKST